MKATVKRKDHCAVITFEGDTSGLIPGPFPEVLEALNDGALEIVLNFANVTFINPNGIKSLKESLEAVKKRNATLGIAEPRPNVRRTLKMSGLVPEIPIYYSEREAIVNLDHIDYREDAIKEHTDRILIIQQDLSIAGHLREALKKHPQKPHYRMIPVRNLARAMDILNEDRVDCILIECGFSLVKISDFIEKVETDSRLPKIPIVVICTDDKLPDSELLIKNGAHEILRFPFNPIETVVRIQTVISHMKDHKPFIPPAKVVQPRGYMGKN